MIDLTVPCLLVLCSSRNRVTSLFVCVREIPFCDKSRVGSKLGISSLEQLHRWISRRLPFLSRQNIMAIYKYKLLKLGLRKAHIDMYTQ